MACTSITPIQPEIIPQELYNSYELSGRKLVDVHNYLNLILADGDMIVDATWPISTTKYGFRVNEEFIMGEDQLLSCKPIKTWVVPENVDPQEFKDQLLLENFSREELVFRDAFILALGNGLS